MQVQYDRLLVTGGAGFIGSHTVDALLANGSEVWVLDDLSTGSLSNLVNWKRSKQIHIVTGSVTNPRRLTALSRKVDAVIHLAAVVSPNISTTRPEITNRINVVGTLNTLRAAQKSQVKRVVFASSASVYGSSSSNLIQETVPLNPMTAYGVSKLAGEKYCRVFNTAFDMETVSLRYFNVYGPRQTSNPYSGVIAIFVQKFLRGRVPSICGDGNQTRDFIHVSDVVRANLLALSTRKSVGMALNIGTGKPTTIRRLFEQLAGLTGCHGVEPKLKAMRSGDIRNSCADMSKARTHLGFESLVDLSRGLTKLVEWIHTPPTKSAYKHDS